MSHVGLLAVTAFLCMTFGKVDLDDGPVLVVIGDSWGAYGWHDLQKVLTSKGSNLTVVSYAIGMHAM